MTWESFVPWFDRMLREVLARQDMRNPRSDFAGALRANADGTAVIGEQASVASQRTLPVVNTGSKLSAQNIAPLSSTFSTTATITIAAHTVQYGFGEVAYGGGSVTGLDGAELYYVYADDPGYDGGPVSYVATKEPLEVVAANQRYYVGSIITSDGSPTTGTGGGGWGWQDLVP